MLVLVTGAAGFIGSHLTDRLLLDGHEVIGVDDLSAGLVENLAPAVELHRLDITEPDFAEVVRDRRPEVICHLAAQVSVRKSVTDPVCDAHTNVVGTVGVLEAARSANVRKIVYTSSVAVYGVPAALPVSAYAVPHPRSPYGASKTCGEIYLDTYRALHGLDYTTITPANVYGPRQNPGGEAGVVAIFTDALLDGRSTTIYGDGSNTRDYVFVLDLVDAYARACGERGGGRRFNIGTGIQTTDRRLHTLIAETVGALDEPTFAAPRPGDLPAMAVDPVPAMDGLDWRPRTNLREGLEATAAWARDRKGRVGAARDRR